MSSLSRILERLGQSAPPVNPINPGQRTHKMIDRAEYVAGQRVNYPPIMREIAGQYRNHKAHITAQGDMVFECEADGLDVANMYVKMLENPSMRKDLAQMNCMHNFDGENPGGSYSDYVSGYGYGGGMLSAREFAREVKGETHILRDRFFQHRDEILTSGVKEELEKMMMGTKKRRRSFSEHDGDWNHDRKWDSQPFEAISSAHREFPFVELCFPLGMNCAGTTGGIAEFLSRCLALAEVLEAAGYRVAITAEDWTDSNLRYGVREIAKEIDPEASDSTCRAGNATEITRYILRDSTSYGSADQYAKLASVEMFRRVTFALLCPQAHWIHALDGREIDQGSGSWGAAVGDRLIPARPGQVILTADNAARVFSMDPEIMAKAFGEFLAFTSKRHHEHHD